MIKITNDNFSLRQISESGQCFRLSCLSEEKYGLTAFGRYLELWQSGNEISFSCTREEFDTIWKNYFDLDRDYGRIIDSIEGDDYLQKAALYGSGIRILKQDVWEMIISFIVSQQNNIRRITKSIDLLCRKYGEERTTETGVIYHTFPTPEKLAEAALEDLYTCGLGYRSRYIKKSAQSVFSGEVNLETLPLLAYEAAVEELLKLYGVGRKVADCICLFGLHRLEAFPKDTHINKVMKTQYPEGFPCEKYKGCLGIVQQYIFFYDLKHGKQ